MTPHEERLQRLQYRFEVIREAVSLSQGKEIAFAAGACVWLMAIENSARASMEVLAAERKKPQLAQGEHPQLNEFKQELREELQGFHQELCKYLNVPHADVLRVSHSFDEFLNDMFRSKG